jgi:predicted outer membrane repeat protein
MHGGAMMSFDDAALSGCLFEENHAKKEGGAINHQKGRLEVSKSRFVNCTAEVAGNEIVNFDDALIRECEFTDKKLAVANNAPMEIAKTRFSQTLKKAIKDPDASSLTLTECEFKKIDISSMNERNFEYLDGLVNSGQKELTLDSDITLDDGEVSIYPDGIGIDSDGIVIDGDGHSIDAKGGARIFTVDAQNIILKNITLKNGYSKGDGGALYLKSNAECKIVNGKFLDNSCGVDGGAIINFGDLTLKESIFEANTSNDRGGAIFNNNNILDVSSTSFRQNASKANGGAIISFGKTSISDCEFEGNDSQEEGGAINHQKNLLELSKSRFTNDTAVGSGNAVITFDKAAIEECEFTNGKYIISNNAEMAISKCRFSLPFDEAIRNPDDESLAVTGCEFKEKELPQELLETEERNFRFLESLLTSGVKEIRLDSDITLDSNEESEYSYGIEIENKGIVLDGDGHTIDARGKARIFRIAAEFTLKNITLTNAHCEDDGGAISAWESLKLENVKFKDNTSEKSGGTIRTMADLDIRDCTFEGNSSNEYGGAILSTFDSKLSIDQSRFIGNASKDKGGAIHNINEMTITNSVLKDNRSKIGGAINSISSEVMIIDTEFSENRSDDRGCDLYQERGNLKFENVTFSSFKRMSVYSEDYRSVDTSYSVEFEGCRFDNAKFDEFKSELDKGPRNFTYLDRLIKYSDGEILLDSDITLDDNEASEYEEGIRIDTEGAILNGNGHSIDARGKARIFNVDKTFALKNITLKNGFHSNSGGAIYNSNNLVLEEVTFLKNTSRNWGGALSNQNIINTEVKITSCRFYENEGSSGSCMFVTSGPLEIDNCKFERNTGYSGVIDTLYEDTEITITNSRFCGNSLERSGVIYNSSKTKVIDCIFSENTAGSGSAIENIKDITVMGSKFYGNVSKEMGGAVYNRNGGNVLLNDCIFENNDAEKGACMYDEEGKIEIRDCEISSHTTDASLIHTEDYFESSNSIFNANKAQSVIMNDEKSDLIIINGEFKSNNSEYSAICNVGRDCTITRASFESNHSQYSSPDSIYSETRMTLNDIKVEDVKKSITNRGKLSLKDLPDEFEELISNEGEIVHLGGKIREGFNFTYLDELIRKSEGKMVELTEDIRLDDDEKDFYEGGIELNIEGLTIDGKGKTIDANGLSRAFLITAKGITLKNITFKNGFTFKNYDNEFNGGGVIHNNSYGELAVENCRFEDSFSENNGGAINNYGELSVEESEFKNNTTKRLGGAIYTYKNSRTAIRNSKFDNNSTEDGSGGAIHNMNRLNVNSSLFSSNASSDDGGAIYHEGENLELIDVQFIDNNAEFGGGAIKALSRTSVLNGIFENNRARNGGALNLYYSKLLTVRNSRFSKNRSEHGGAIYNNSCDKVDIYGSSFENNEGSQEGGVVNWSSGTLNISDSTFNGNESGKGGVIYATYGANNIRNSQMKNNSASQGGAIYNGNILKLQKTSFEANRADDGGAIYNIRLRKGNPPFSPPELPSEITVDDVIFKGNTAESKGGAIYNEKTGQIKGNSADFKANKAKEGKDIWAENDSDVNISSSNASKGRLKGLFNR